VNRYHHVIGGVTAIGVLLISAVASATTYPGAICMPASTGDAAVMSHWFGTVSNTSSTQEMNLICPFPKNADYICPGSHIDVYERNPQTKFTCALYTEFTQGPNLFFWNESHDSGGSFGSNIQSLTFNGAIGGSSYEYYYAVCTVPRVTSTGYSHVVALSIGDCHL
jgi:hypothetical protein